MRGKVKVLSVMIHLLLALFLCGSVQAKEKPYAERPAYGILLLAHGGDPSWNKEIQIIQEGLKSKVPAEVALGMADPGEIQKAVERLETRNPAKIVVVPLFVNSVSEVLEQTRYVLGIAERPSEIMRMAAKAHAHHGHVMFSLKRVKTKLPLTMTQALDADPLVAEILLERAKGLSRSPAQETVILVGHGPVTEESNLIWMRTIRELAQVVKENGKFKAVHGLTIRDDAPEPIRGKAIAALRETARKEGLKTKVIVIPYLIAQGGIEKKIAAALKDVSHVWNGETLCPHPNMLRWVFESAARGAKKEDMRRFK